MFGTRIRKILGDVWSRKGRTALVALSIMIGVFGVTVLVGMGDLLITQLDEDLNEDSIAMTHVYMVALGGQITLEQNHAFMDQLETLPGVERVEGQAIYPQDWHLAGADEFEAGSMIAFTEPFEEVQLEPVSRVIEGRYPVGGQNEIAVERRFADEHEVGIGDKLVFRGSEATEWEIVGIVFQPYMTMTPHVTDVTNPATPPETNIYATYKDAQAIVGFPGLSSIYARYSDVELAREGLNDFVETISAKTPYITAFSFIDDPLHSAQLEGAKQFTLVLNILAVVAMFVSALLVVNVIYTIIVEQKQQIGVMKSLGASWVDVALVYAGMAFVYGLIGTVLGVLIATPIASMMAVGLAPMMGTYLDGMQISQTGIIVGLVLGLLVPVVISLFPVYLGTRVTILEAITNLGLSSNWGNTRFSRFIGRLPVSLNIRQALSNIVIKRWRLLLTMLTLTFAFSAFMGVTALFSSLDQAIADIFDTFENEIQMTTQAAEDPEAVNQLIRENIDGVDRVVSGYGVSVSLEGYTAPANSFSAGSQVQAVGVDTTEDVVNFRYSAGTGWSDDPDRSGIVLNRTVAENIDKTAGDTVNVTVGGETYEYEVIGVDEWPFDTVFFRWQDLATIAGYTNAEGNPNPGTYWIDLAGDPDADTVADVIDELKVLAAANGIQAVYANQPENEENISQLIASFGMLFNMTSFVMAAVGAIGLLATLSMAVYERQKEIGVMRSLGAGSGTIVSQFLVEGILVGVIAWMIALPLSYLLGVGINTALDLEEFFHFNYPPLVAVQGLLGVILIASIASIWPSISAARKTVSDILRYQ